MALLSDYTAGTVSVAANGTAVTGVGTTWKTAGFKEGDWFIANGWVNVVASVDSETTMTLAQPWRGGALTAATYRLRYMSDGSRVSAQARQLIDMLGGSGNLEALGGLNGSNGDVPYFTGPGVMGLLTKADITQGVQFDAMVDTLPDRDAYDGEPVGFTVLVADTGDGRAAIYVREGGAGNWSAPAYITGPSLTLAVDQVDPLPYGDDPTVTLNSVAGGYELNFGIPQGMEIVPGTVTTLSPGSPATVDFVPVTGGYQLNFGLPKGDTGTLTGLTPFYQTQVTTAADAAAARTGLGAVGYAQQSLTPAQAGQARANIDADILAGFRNKIINGCGEVAQRTPGFVTSGAFLCDHWQHLRDGVGGSVAWQTVPFGQFTEQLPGNPKTYLQITQSVAPGGTYNTLRLPMEGVNTLAGRKATVTLYARFPTGPGDTIAKFELRQNFGTGGSADVYTFFGEGGVQPGVNFTKVQFVVDVPSISSKTIGSNNNDCLELYIYLPTTETFVFDITKVSVVEGDATAEDDPFSPRHIQQELALCQRYYCRLRFSMVIPAVGDMMTYHNFPVEMRAVPSSAQVSAGVTSDLVIVNGGADLTKAGVGFQARATATNGTLTGFVAEFDAEL